jgi:uncharacterized protein YidB (DUF937 family)
VTEKELHVVSMNRLSEAVRSFGLQKQLAAEIGISDTELSRLLHEQAPRLIRVMSVLGLELADAGEVSDLKRVLKRCL